MQWTNDRINSQAQHLTLKHKKAVSRHTHKQKEYKQFAPTGKNPPDKTEAGPSNPTQATTSIMIIM